MLKLKEGKTTSIFAVLYVSNRYDCEYQELTVNMGRKKGGPLPPRLTFQVLVACIKTFRIEFA